jgi:hypothetical protein
MAYLSNQKDLERCEVQFECKLQKKTYIIKFAKSIASNEKKNTLWAAAKNAKVITTLSSFFLEKD